MTGATLLATTYVVEVVVIVTVIGVVVIVVLIIFVVIAIGIVVMGIRSEQVLPKYPAEQVQTLGKVHIPFMQLPSHIGTLHVKPVLPSSVEV